MRVFSRCKATKVSTPNPSNKRALIARSSLCPRGAVAANLSIPTIFRASRFSKVDPAIIAAIAIDVVNLDRPFPHHIEKSQPARSIKRSVNLDAMVSFVV
jgi:hypothetical protein